MISLLITLVLFGGVSASNDTAYSWINYAYLRNFNKSSLYQDISIGTIIVEACSSTEIFSNCTTAVTGLVCDDYFKDDAADFLCRKAGFDYSINWTSHYQTDWRDKAPSSLNLTFALDDLRCREDASYLNYNCSFQRPIGSHNCRNAEAVVLECGNEEEDRNDTVIERWINYAYLQNANESSLYHNVNHGTVMVKASMHDGYNTVSTTGMVCDDSFNNNTADFLCRKAGFDYSKSWSSHYNTDLRDQTFPFNNLTFALDDLICGENARSLDKDCSFRTPIGSHNCANTEAVVLECGNVRDPYSWINYAYLQNFNENSLYQDISVGTIIVKASSHIEESNSTTAATGLVCDDSFNDDAADFLCRKAGFDYSRNWTNHWNTDRRDKAPLSLNLTFALDDLRCSEDASYLNDDCSFRKPIGSHNCGNGEAVVLECGNEDRNSDWIMAGMNVTADKDNGQMYYSNYGTVEVEMVNPRNGRWIAGMVCDDGMTNATADFLCRRAGYPRGLKFWSNNWNTPASHSLSEEWYYSSNMTFSLDQLVCPEGATDFQDCSHNDPGVHDCRWGEGLVLNCLTDEDSEFDLDNVTVTLQTGNGWRGSNGTVVVYDNYGERGFICHGEDMNLHTANVLCRAAGFSYATKYNVSYEAHSYDKLDCGYIKNEGLKSIAGDVNCSWNASHISDCSAYSIVNGSSCDVDSSLVLSCSHEDRPSWEIVNVTLARNPGGGHDEGDVIYDGYQGTVLATIYNRRTGEQVTGLVSRSGTEDMIDNYRAICRAVGGRTTWPWDRSAGYIQERYGLKLSCGYVLEHGLEFVIGTLNCNGTQPRLAEDCEFTVAGRNNTGDPFDALWLRC